MALYSPAALNISPVPLVTPLLSPSDMYLTLHPILGAWRSRCIQLS